MQDNREDLHLSSDRFSKIISELVCLVRGSRDLDLLIAPSTVYLDGKIEKSC